MENIRVYMQVKETSSLGPFSRYALWVQGCKKKCEGCISPGSRSFECGEIIPIDDIVEDILSLEGNEGMTISGGEPFLQAGSLVKVVQSVRKKRDFGVIIYSGYTLYELREMALVDSSVGHLLNQCDLLIDGPFIESLNDGLSLRGSSNQNIHLLTDRYKEIADKYYGIEGRKVEWRLENREMKLIGIPEKKISEIFSKAFKHE